MMDSAERYRHSCHPNNLKEKTLGNLSCSKFTMAMKHLALAKALIARPAAAAADMPAGSLSQRAFYQECCAPAESPKKVHPGLSMRSYRSNPLPSSSALKRLCTLDQKSSVRDRKLSQGRALAPRTWAVRHRSAKMANGNYSASVICLGCSALISVTWERPVR